MLWLLCCSKAYSVGLGEIKLYSYFDEPLDAEIIILGAHAIEPSDLLVRLASSASFNSFGVKREPVHSNLTFKVNRLALQTVVSVTTSRPVRVPFIDFLVDFIWAEGQLIKGYTLFLNPPPATNAKANRPKSIAATLRLNNTQDKPKPVSKPAATEVLEDADAIFVPEHKVEVESNQKVAPELKKLQPPKVEPVPLPSPPKITPEPVKEVVTEASQEISQEIVPSPNLKQPTPPIVPASSVPVPGRTKESSIILPLVIVILFMGGAGYLGYRFADRHPLLGKMKDELDKLYLRVLARFNNSKTSTDEHEFLDELAPIPDEINSAFDFLTNATIDVKQKLNLAQNYIAAGDLVSAKELLEQIIPHSKDADKDEAIKLLQHINQPTTQV